MALGWSEPTKTLSWFIQIYVIAFRPQKLKPSLERRAVRTTEGRNQLSFVFSRGGLLW